MNSRSGYGVGLIGTGSCMPRKVLTNFDLEKMVDTTNEWIVQRTGISERRILERDESVMPLALKAAKEAVEDAGLTPEQIDMIIVASSTPEYLSPPLSARLQHEIGAGKCAAFDMNATCTGFVYALSTAESFIRTGAYEHVLVVAAESLSRSIDWNHRSTCVLFGDGVGAAVLGRVERDYGVLESILGSDGGGGDLITIPCTFISDADIERRAGKRINSICLDGGKVLKFASRVMASCVEELLDMGGIDLDEIKLLIPHQAKLRIIDNSIKRIGISPDRVFVNINKYGNTSSASAAVALDEAAKAGMLKYGDYYIMVAFGGGLTYGALLMRWCK